MSAEEHGRYLNYQHGCRCDLCRAANAKRCYQYQRNARRRARGYVIKYLLEHSCIDCGQRDPRVLEFDHVRGKKTINISKALTDKWSNTKLQAEIDKCEVVCRNCHAVRTAERGEHYNDLSEEVRDLYLRRLAEISAD